MILRQNFIRNGGKPMLAKSRSGYTFSVSLVFLGLTLLLSACGDSPTATPPPAPTATKAPTTDSAPRAVTTLAGIGSNTLSFVGISGLSLITLDQELKAAVT